MCRGTGRPSARAQSFGLKQPIGRPGGVRRGGREVLVDHGQQAVRLSFVVDGAAREDLVAI
jgi:hypothetical protein